MKVKAPEELVVVMAISALVRLERLANSLLHVEASGFSFRSAQFSGNH